MVRLSDPLNHVSGSLSLLFFVGLPRHLGIATRLCVELCAI